MIAVLDKNSTKEEKKEGLSLFSYTLKRLGQTVHGSDWNYADHIFALECCTGRSGGDDAG